MGNMILTTIAGLAEILQASAKTVRSWLKEKNLTGASGVNNLLPVEVNQVPIVPLLTPADVAAIFGTKKRIA
jgi:hypothetical protein